MLRDPIGKVDCNNEHLVLNFLSNLLGQFERDGLLGKMVVGKVRCSDNSCQDEIILDLLHDDGIILIFNYLSRLKNINNNLNSLSLTVFQPGHPTEHSLIHAGIYDHFMRTQLTYSLTLLKGAPEIWKLVLSLFSLLSYLSLNLWSDYSSSPSCQVFHPFLTYFSKAF